MNGAFLVDTDLAPNDLLGVLTAIENTLHRERSERWGPRTIDLDLLLYDDLVIEQPGLTVPHPRMATRRFVLEPCAEIAPDVVHPVSGCSIRDMLGNISVDHPHVAVVGVPGSGAAEVAAAVAKVWLDTALVEAQDMLSGDDGAPPPGQKTKQSVPPHVVILIVAEPPVLAKRLMHDGRRECTAVALQNQLRHRLLSPASTTNRRPKAVVVVEANDLDRAISEAVAAVEAMA
jgi:hypothetical protein